MKFLVDAHLPQWLLGLLRDAGHDSLHTCALKNNKLAGLFEQNLGLIVAAFEHHTYVELGRSHLTVHR